MTRNPHAAKAASIRLYEAEASPERTAARFGVDPEKIIDFSLNINPFGPPESALAAAREALARSNEYPDVRLAALRRALAARHDVPENAIFFGSGLDDVIKLLIHAWTSEGDLVLVHLPTFPRYELEARLRGCAVVPVRSNPPWEIEVDAIRSALERARVSLAFLCTPNNPTGATFSMDDIRVLCGATPDTLFIVDEALINPREAGAIPLIRTHPNLAVLRTFSKYWGLAGLRVGYAVAAPDLVAIVEVGRPPFNVAHASAAAALAVLDDAAFLAHCRTAFAAEAEFVVCGLERIRGARLRGLYSNMLLVELSDRGAQAVVDALAARGILVANGGSFRGLESHETIRVSLRGRADNVSLLSALEATL